MHIEVKTILEVVKLLLMLFMICVVLYRRKFGERHATKKDLDQLKIEIENAILKNKGDGPC